MPIWIGDEDSKKFEAHGHPTNMVVDLGKRLCTCQFWMLTKIHVHSATCPNIKRRARAITKKRRKDADEGNSSNKKGKPTRNLKRHLKPFACRYCGVKGDTKRGCSKKRLDEIAAALAAAKAAADKAKSNAAAPTSEAGPQPHIAAAPVDKPSVVEIEISQPNYEGSQDIAGSAAPAPSRLEKLPTKRRSSLPPQSIGVDLIQGASVATSFRFANFMKFVPTPGFKAPRKK
ncbi:hypothetical protein Ahy_A03g011759 [Arachis hypogaea]|uniref:Uncharacterized protein n=1 Tax=Arachis hypogaea TaxID=3818 RepID=A0A445DRN6_ARAHY|nr:hypothetical protein Ahy_A03g011759 [Arachis hypogaea]